MKKTKEGIWKQWCAKDLSWTESALGAMQEYADQVQSEVIPSDEEIKDQLIKEQKQLIVALSDQVALICGELAIDDMEKYGYMALNISKKIRFAELNIASLESQLKPAVKEEKNTQSAKIENEFEKELLSLINQYCERGLKKPDLVHKMKYVTKNCKLS